MSTILPRDGFALLPGFTGSVAALRKLARDLSALTSEIENAAETLERTNGEDHEFGETFLCNDTYTYGTGRHYMEIPVPKELRCHNCNAPGLDGSIDDEGLCLDCAGALLDALQDTFNRGRSEDHPGLFQTSDYTRVFWTLHFIGKPAELGSLELDPEDMDRLPAIMRAALYGLTPTGAFKITWTANNGPEGQIEAPEQTPTV